jgi:hypothetical protein
MAIVKETGHRGIGLLSTTRAWRAMKNGANKKTSFLGEAQRIFFKTSRIRMMPVTPTNIKPKESPIIGRIVKYSRANTRERIKPSTNRRSISAIILSHTPMLNKDLKSAQN